MEPSRTQLWFPFLVNLFTLELRPGFNHVQEQVVGYSYPDYLPKSSNVGLIASTPLW